MSNSTAMTLGYSGASYRRWGATHCRKRHEVFERRGKSPKGARARGSEGRCEAESNDAQGREVRHAVDNPIGEPLSQHCSEALGCPPE